MILVFQGSFNNAILPAFERLSRTRHGAVPLESRADILRQAELVNYSHPSYVRTQFSNAQASSILCATS